MHSAVDVLAEEAKLLGREEQIKQQQRQKHEQLEGLLKSLQFSERTRDDWQKQVAELERNLDEESTTCIELQRKIGATQITEASKPVCRSILQHAYERPSQASYPSRLPSRKRVGT